MKHNKLLQLSALLFLSFTLDAAALEINVTQPGTLQDLILDSEGDISTLTLKGTLNAADVEYLTGESGKILQVEHLDLTDIALVESETEPYRSFTIWAEAGGGENAVCYYSKNARLEYKSSTGGLGMPILTWYIYGTDMTGLLAKTKFKKVTLPKSIGKVGDYFCLNATGLEEAVIPETATAIGDMAFQGTSLKKVNIPSAATSIGNSAFENTPIEAVTLPLGVTSIGGSAFRICDKLASINLENVREIGSSAFSYCYSITSANLGNVERIEDEAFQNCPLNTLTLSDKLKSIGSRAFYVESYIGEKANLTEIAFPESLDSICSEAFSGTKLAKVTIPETISYIGRDAFKGTPWDNSIASTAIDNVVYFGSMAYKVVNKPTSVVFREGTTTISGNVDLWKTKEITLPNSCQSIYAVNFDVMEKAVLGSGLKIIGENCFSNATNMTGIELPASLEIIGAGAFCGSGLKSLTLPEGLKRIEGSSDSSFGSTFGSTHITSLTLPEGLEYIGDDTFQGCDALATVRYNCRNAIIDGFGTDQWGYIFPGIFMSSGIEKVIIGPNVETIPSGLFGGTNTIVRLEFEESETPLIIGDFNFTCAGRYGTDHAKVKGSLDRVTSIGNDAMDGLEFPAGTALDFPNLKSIGHGALKNFAGVQSLTLNSGIEHIGYQAIMNFEGLQKFIYDIPNAKLDAPENWNESLMPGMVLDTLVIGRNVERIDDHLFSNVDCNSLVFEPRQQTRGASSLSIGAGAFGSNHKLTCVDLPSDLIAMGSYAFGECYELQTAYFHSDETPAIGEKAFTYKTTVYVPAESESAYKAALSSNTVVPYRLESVTLDKSAVRLDAGASVTLTARIAPAECSEMAIEWTSSNPEVATVNSRGEVTAVSDGKAEITATIVFDNNFKGRCLVTVGEDAGADEIERDDSEVIGYYTLDGVRVENPTAAGIYIVRMGDGSTEKRIVK